MTDPERIWLEPECCACPDTGRLWCQHKVWPDDECREEPTEYVLAAALTAAEGRTDRLREALPNAAQRAVGERWLREHGRLVKRDPAFVAAAVYRMMRLAVIDPDAPEIRMNVVDEAALRELLAVGMEP